ncbi:Ribose import permease protein RbsC [subsurface metagenome]
MLIARKLSKFFSYQTAGTLLVFIGLILVFTFFTPHHLFIDPRNIKALAKLTPDLGIVALGVGMLMICGEFDLSVGAVLPFCSYVFVLLSRAGVNLVLSLFIAMGVGALLGLLNGLITVKGHIPSFIATLGTMMFWRGVLYVHSRMWPIGIRAYLPAGSSFEHVLIGEIGGILPVQVVWFVVFGLVLGVVLHFHKFGNWVYATGDNKEAARAMGINTDRVKTICFMIVGILCAFVGVIQLLRLGSFAATQGLGFELKAIAASVVGGTFLMGGVGSIAGVFLGALTIQILENGLILMRVPVFGISAFIGLAIILFVVLNAYMRRRMIR